MAHRMTPTNTTNALRALAKRVMANFNCEAEGNTNTRLCADDEDNMVNALAEALAARQAQDTDGKIIAALHAELARLRHLLGGRAYETPVSGYDPTDMHTESVNVDMRQTQGGGEDGK